MTTQNRIKTVLTLAIAAVAVLAASANASWTPAELKDGVELWLDAADASTITKDGSNMVSQWNDKSGNDRHVSQSGSPKPTYVETGFNGGTMPSLQFVEGDGAHAGNSLTLSGLSLPASEWAVFAVVDDQSNDNEQMLFAAPAGGFDEHRVWLDLRGPSIRSDSGNGGSSNATHVAGEQQLYFVLSGTSSEVLRDGTQVAGNNGTYVNRPIIKFSVGARGETGHAGMNGDIAEFILLSYVPSTDDREMLEGYLAWKWGLEDALPGDHTYKTAAPWADPNFPEVDAGVDMISWSGQAVAMEPNVVETPGSDWTSLTYLWTAEPNGIGDPDLDVAITGADTEYASVTITKTAPTGDATVVTMTLAVNNEDREGKPVQNSMTIDVYDDSCLAAQAIGPVLFDITDIDGNCVTAFPDFAVMAATWLDDYTLTAPVPK